MPADPESVLKRIKAHIFNDAMLRLLITRVAGPDARTSSCAATATLVARIINGSARAIETHERTAGDVVALIDFHLQRGQMVAVTLAKPEHYFVLFGLPKDKVVLLQGWQERYTLLDWWRRRSDGGIMARLSLSWHLRALLSSDPEERARGARILFEHYPSDGVVEIFRREGPSKFTNVTVSDLGTSDRPFL